MILAANGTFELGPRALKVMKVNSGEEKNLQLDGFSDAGVVVLFDGVTITGVNQPFVLWRNTQWSAGKVRWFLAQMLDHGFGLQVGPAVDRPSSAQGTLALLDTSPSGKKLYGLYLPWDSMMAFQLIAWKKMGVKFPPQARRAKDLSQKT
jgi:hypothetical protein